MILAQQYFFLPDDEMEQLSDEQKEKLQEIFKTFDADGDGVLTRDELLSALKCHVKVGEFADRGTYDRVIAVIEEIVFIVDEGRASIYFYAIKSPAYEKPRGRFYRLDNSFSVFHPKNSTSG